MSGYTYLHSVISNPDLEKFTLGIALGAGLIALSSMASRRLRTPEGIQQAVVPTQKISTFGIFDLFVEKFTHFHDSILGKENRKHVPFCGGVFLFVFLANVMGLIPGMPGITTTVWINVAMALVVFIYFNAQGIKENGFWTYIKHFAGPVVWLAWLIFPLEIISTLMRILTLNLRLYWNMSADHILLGIFTELAPWGVPVLFYALGLFVSFMQAFVFSLLTMVYILLASSHEHGDDEGHGHDESHNSEGDVATAGAHH